MIRTKNPRRVAIDSAGISLCVKETPSAALPWSRIVVVTGFLKDCFSTDQMRLWFLSDDGVVMEITEDDPGFKDLIVGLAEYLPALEGWYEKMAALPAFSRDVLTLMDRKAADY